jgi:multiple sugar transport system substrate-binding protein
MQGRFRRHMLLTAMVVAGVLTLATAGCGTSPSDSGSGASGGPITLNFWDYFGYSPTSDKAVESMIQKYEAIHPNVKINRTKIGFPDFHAKLLQAAATGKFPDIAAIDNADVPLFASQGALADMTQYLEAWPEKDQYLPAVLQSTKYNGKNFGIPFRSNTTALWYNQDAFTEAGITKAPATWEELRTDAKKLTNSKRSGICFSAAPTEEGTFTFLPMLWQGGGDVPSIGDAGTVAALNYVKNLVNVDKSAPKSVLTWGQSDVGEQFGAGTCAMQLNGPWVLASARKGKFKFATAPWPSGPAGTASPLGGEVWAVGKSTKSTAAVWDVLSWMSDPKNTTEEIASGLNSIPNRTDTLGDKDWNWDTTVLTFAQQMRSAHARGIYGPNYAQISTAISTMEQAVLAQDKDPQAAANTAAATIKPLLSGQ